MVVFSRSLKADKENSDRRRPGYVQRLVGLSQQLAQLVKDDLDELLPRRNAREHFFAEHLLFDLFKEILCDFVIDVRLEEGDPHLSQGVLDVGFGQFAVAP